MSDKENIHNKFNEKIKNNSSSDIGVKDLLTFNNAIENKPVENVVSLIENTDKEIGGVTAITLANKIINSSRSSLEKRDMLTALLKKNLVNFFIDMKIYKKDTCLLFDLILKGDPVLVNTILTFKPKVNMKDSCNRNALFYAVTSNASEKDKEIMISALLSQGLTLNDIEKQEGHNLLTLSAAKNLPNLVKFLLSNGANINHSTNKEGYTCLHYSVINDNIELFQFLLDYNGIDLSLKSRENETFEELARRLKRTDILCIFDKMNHDKRKHSIGELCISKGENEINEAFIVGDDKESYNCASPEENYSFTHDSEKNNIRSYLRQTVNGNKEIVVSGVNKNEEITAYLSIPISFQKTNIKSRTNLKPHEITIGNNPTLNLDLSNDIKIANLLKNEELTEYKKIFNRLENEKGKQLDEIHNLQILIGKMKEDLESKDKKILGLLNEISELKRVNDILQKSIKAHQDEKEKFVSIYQVKFERLEKENKELNLKIEKCVKNDNIYQNSANLSRDVYLERKYSYEKYDEKYSAACLHKDILDFQELTKNNIKELKPTQEELIDLVKESVSECIDDYEVLVYGSYATNLCLPWSDIDLVLIPKVNVIQNQFTVLKVLTNNLQKKYWKKNVKLIDNTSIPIIKIICTEKYKNMLIDISIQDHRHYGLRCVELVKTFLKEYEVLEPIVLALKNILKWAGLNDPYTGGLSSYGLILLVVSFLQSQIEVKKSVKMEDLGLIFLEFLYYYGYIFDHTSYIVFTNISNQENNLDPEISAYLNQNPHDIIIIDPLSKTNNVAKSTFQYSHIKMAFLIAFSVAKESCECGCHYQKNQGEMIVLEHCILKRIFLSVKRFHSQAPN